MKSVVITTDTAGERFLGFVDSAAEAGITYDTHEAESLSSREADDPIFKKIEYIRHGDTKGMVGCTLSHLELYRQVVESDETTLILEDDARFDPSIDYEAILSDFEATDNDVLYLHFNDSDKVETTGIHKVNKVIGNSTTAYFIKPSGAKRLLSFLGKGGTCPTIIDAFHRQAIKSDVSFAFYDPHPVTHSGVESTLANSDYLKLPKEPIAPKAPMEVLMVQVKDELIVRELLDDVDAIIAAIPDTTQRAIVQNWLDNAPFARQDNEKIIMFATALSLDIEEFFLAASGR